MLFPFKNIFHSLKVLASLLQRFEYPAYDTSGGQQVARELPAPLPPTPLVDTPLGSYEGYFMTVLSGRDIYAFEGIPFAEPPERFKAPVKKKPFRGTFSAKAGGSDCIQTYVFTVVNPTSVFFGDEDCLTCSIFTPMISFNGSYPDLPVIVNFYGGSFAVGSKNDYGPAYLLERDLVLVNCNYRIGVHGFFSTGDAVASGNWGLKDAAMAVDFVHENIRYFGGDPNRIVLFGQSAGAALVHLLAISSWGKEGKIAGAICSSGSALTFFGADDPAFAKQKAWRLAVMSFCPTNRGSEAMVNCLRRRNPKYLMMLQNIIHLTEETVLQFRPIVEPNVPGALITQPPEKIIASGNIPNVPILFMTTSGDVEAVHIILKSLRVPIKGVTRILSVFLPELLEFRGRVNGREREVSERILEYYGGIEYLEKNHTAFFRMLNDRYFLIGFNKSLKKQSTFAPTFAMYFYYKTSRGFVARSLLKQNPSEFDTPHAEDLFYIFNRTDIESVSRRHPDYKIVRLFQDIFYNFAAEGKFHSVNANAVMEDLTIDSSTETFKMLEIGPKETKVAETHFETNVTKFWDSLRINLFPSFKE